MTTSTPPVPAAAPPAGDGRPDPRPAVQPTESAAVAAVAPMKPRRVWVVYGLLAVLVLPHLYEAAAQKEHWPFSPYQMWSVPSRGWSMNREMLRGVTAEGREVPLTPRHLYPLPYDMVVVNMREAAKAVREMEAGRAESAKRAAAGDAAGAAKFAAEADKKRQAADRIVGGLMKQYNARRDARQHDGPALVGMRLYQVALPIGLDATVEANKAKGVTTLLYQGPDADKNAVMRSAKVADRITSEFGDDSNND